MELRDVLISSKALKPYSSVGLCDHDSDDIYKKQHIDMDIDGPRIHLYPYFDKESGEVKLATKEELYIRHQNGKVAARIIEEELK